MPTTTIVVNNPSLINERSRISKKTGKAGKARVTIDVKAEPIAFHYDARSAAPAAEAIREVLSEQIKSVSAAVKSSTLKARRYAKTAYDAGKPWAVRRFSGGRIGPTPPDGGTVRMFNNSGRLAENLSVRWNSTDETFTTNVPANRFDERVFDPARKKEILTKLAQLVPALSNPGALLNHRKVKRGLKETHDAIVTKLRATNDLKSHELRQAKVNALKAFFGLVA